MFSFDSADGLKTIVAKAAAGDVIWFLATINRIAEILAVRGDTDPIGVRRARAVGILARPAEALRLLIEHQHDDTDNRDDPTEALDPDSPPLRRSPQGARAELHLRARAGTSPTLRRAAVRARSRASELGGRAG